MSRRQIFVIILHGLLVALVACNQTASETEKPISYETLVITNGVVIDGTGAAPIQDGTVVIEKGLIVDVGYSDDIAIPPDARVLDARGATVLPGFIDSHVHGTADPAVRRDFILGGVTAICDLGSTIEDMPRFEVEMNDEGAVARGFHSGPIMTAPGGAPDVILHVDYNYEVATPEEAHQGVRDLIARGADVIKVYLEQGSVDEPYPTLDIERLQAIVDEAHTANVLVRAHVTRFELLPLAVEAGVDSIEHVPLFTLSNEEIERLANSSDPEQEAQDIVDFDTYRPLLQRMVDDEIALVPTLDRVIGTAYRTKDPTPIEQLGADAYLGVVGDFHDLGGTVALGTDFNVDLGMTRGMPIGELELLLAAGLTPIEVIEASTRNAAYVCGQESIIGTLEPSKMADLIVVDGDPLADISSLTNVIAVVKGGQIVK